MLELALSAIGLGVSAFGMFQSHEATQQAYSYGKDIAYFQKQGERVERAGLREVHGINREANQVLLGLSREQNANARELNRTRLQQESVRRRQMTLEASRQKREIIRQTLIQRSMALTSATASGAQGGSGLQGAYGGIAASGAANLLGVNQGVALGKTMFGINRDIFGLEREMNTTAYQMQKNQIRRDMSLATVQKQTGTRLSQIQGRIYNLQGAMQDAQAAAETGQAISSAGGALVQNAGTISRLGNYLFTPSTGST